jgi:hypothetical protein
MPIDCWIEQDRRRVRAELRGDFSTAAMLRVISDAVAQPEFERGFSILSDHRQIGQPITTAQLQEVTTHLRRLSDEFKGSRWAVVTTKPASYGMMRMFSVMVEDIPLYVRVFDNFAAAEVWLDSPDESVGS